MKPQICTDQNQSRRLLSCGVNPKTADMSVRTIKEPYGDDMAWHTPKLLTMPYEEAKTIYGNDEIEPAWSLSVLLAMLPNLIMADNRMQFTFRLIKCKDAYIVEYSGHNTSLYQSNGATAIEACVRMIETLTFHKHSLNKIGE